MGHIYLQRRRFQHIFFEKALDFCRAIRYNMQVPVTEARFKWRVVRVGRRSTTGNRVSRKHGFEGSNPLLSAKKKCQSLKKDWHFFLFCYLLSFHYSLFSKIAVFGKGIKENKKTGGFACQKQGFFNTGMAVHFYQTLPAVRLVTKLQAVHTQIKNI